MYKIFVYGTLKKGFALHRYLENSKFLGEGFIKGYDMYQIDWYPVIVKGNCTVFGEIYEVDESTLKILDEIEEEGVYYKRIKEKVYFKGKSIEVFVYVFLGEINNLVKIESGVFISNSE